MYVQQALDPRSGRTGKPLDRKYGEMDLNDLSKSDFLKFAQVAKKLNLDYEAPNFLFISQLYVRVSFKCF